MLISKDTPKEAILELVEKECKLCGHCCLFSSGIVLDDEIPRLAEHLGMSTEEFKKRYLEQFTKFHTTRHRFKQVRVGSAPHGRCVFLDLETNKCKIHEVKPLHCRISTCSIYGEDVQKWFDVNFFLNPNDPQSVREYNLYLEFKEPLLGAELESLLPEEDLKKILNYERW
ncbi:hypothetical protein DRJ48_04995 [Candidatus Woesearchaeota archaeon]|nr:MAG: hypothetical protein DRJ48_04995 [Candidatus Woesearchaeota archaeon]